MAATASWQQQCIGSDRPLVSMVDDDEYQGSYSGFSGSNGGDATGGHDLGGHWRWQLVMGVVEAAATSEKGGGDLCYLEQGSF
ncbi:hypothetical protein U1Q18_051805 [Sarracenia purpurea var. burkii]